MEPIREIASRQYGLFTAAQWKDAGLSLRSLGRREASGLVSEFHPSVFTIAGAPASFHQRVLAACLSVGGVASHRCAAHLWAFRRFEAPVVEVLVKRGRTPSLSDVHVRRTSYLDTLDVGTLSGIPITGRARTLLDLCDGRPALAEGAINGALHKRQVSVQQLLAVLDRVGPRHRGRIPFAGLVTPFASGQRPTGSELEDAFLELVIQRYNLPTPVRQHPFGRRWIDFAYPELELGVEIQSVRGHAAREDVHRNANKANELIEWWILQFAYDDIHLWADETAELIGQTIDRRRRQRAA
jgi:very-short-patch-repair endonuclease